MDAFDAITYYGMVFGRSSFIWNCSPADTAISTFIEQQGGVEFDLRMARSDRLFNPCRFPPSLALGDAKERKASAHVSILDSRH